MGLLDIFTNMTPEQLERIKRGNSEQKPENRFDGIRKYLGVEEYAPPQPLPPKPKFVPTPDMIEGQDYYRPLIYDNTGAYYGDPVDLRDRMFGGANDMNNSGLLQLLKGLK